MVRLKLLEDQQPCLDCSVQDTLILSSGKTSFPVCQKHLWQRALSFLKAEATGKKAVSSANDATVGS